MTWKQYHRLEDIYGFMDYLSKTYPSIISVQDIGKSYEGRNIKVRLSLLTSDWILVFIQNSNYGM